MEKEREELIELLNGIRFIEKAYEVMRIVDPVKKRVLSYKDKEIVETGLACYHFWEKDTSCDACVASKAYRENDTFIKLEYRKEKVYMVWAIPAAWNGMTLIIELCKDVTRNMLVVKKGEDDIEIDVNDIINNSGDILYNDHLTGLFNRRYVDERLQVDILKSSIKKETLSLIMADIDFFKNINDTYGHLAGDHILKVVAGILKSCVRSGEDWVARYGGEEFLVCLPGTDRGMAAKIAERMRAKIEDEVFEYEGQKIKLTTSFGVYSLDSGNKPDVESMIGIADKNLYSAKQSGRNKVVAS